MYTDVFSIFHHLINKDKLIFLGRWWIETFWTTKNGEFIKGFTRKGVITCSGGRSLLWQFTLCCLQCHRAKLRTWLQTLASRGSRRFCKFGFLHDLCASKVYRKESYYCQGKGMQITTSENLPSSRRVSHDVSTDGFLWVSGEHCSTIDLSNYLISYNHCHAKL